jgi:plastocyanin
MNRNFASLGAAAAIATVAFAGCGSDDDSGSSGSSASSSDTATQTTPAATTPASGGSASGNLQIKADPSGALKFDTSSLDAKAGKVTITMGNPSPLPHAVGIEGNGVDKEGKTVDQNGKSTVTADLKAGTYEFYCPVDGHKQAGMKGTLTVK